MVQVYLMDITDLPDPLEKPELMEGLDAFRKEKIMRCRQAKSRKQSLGAGLLIRSVLKPYGEIRMGAHGKPEIEGGYFNISHSDNMVVCVVGEKPVGCDIEKIQDARLKVADRFFGKREKDYLKSFPEKDRDRQFYRLWTMKESYMKMTGEGMSLSLDRFEICVEEIIKVYRDGEIQDCYLKEYTVPDYVISVCSEEEVFSEEISIL